MFNKLLIKIIKKFDYVKNLEINVEQLKAVETRLREEKGDAVREKNRLALKVKYMESVVIDLMNSSLNPPFEMGDQAKPKRCLEY